ncbi:MAG TPA: UDP-N-acetylmuramoyl-tripeptide--D-alanyl-D-alanine ligase [Nitrospirota bacterium]|nr:UDP-N-acetylmuramoyl-tripeptide--D-alanyl-D-alanine ligase [Nitrospirota bacterium]
MEITGISIDSRSIKEGELFVALKGPRFDGHDFVPDALKKGACGALVERTSLEKKYAVLGGLKNILPVEDTLFALQEMAIAHRRKFTIPVVAVTGSNGKTTTKEMIAAMAKQKGPVLKNEGNLNNHIGVPLTLMNLNERHRAAVLEMGMSAAGEIDVLARIVAPTIGVITNIGPAHLEFFGSLDKIADAKGELLDNLNSDAVAVLNADDAFCEKLRTKFNGPIVTFGMEKDADVRAVRIVPGFDHIDFTITARNESVDVRLRMVGNHNIANALAAAAAALAMGIPLDAVKYGIEDFTPVAMRSEVRNIEGRTVLADYYNANPASMEAAIRTMVSLAAGRNAIAVVGDMLELGSASAEIHRNVGAFAARNGVAFVIMLGDLAKHFGEGARLAGMLPSRTIEARTHEEAAQLAKKLSRPGDVILIKGSRGMKMEKILEAF